MPKVETNFVQINMPELNALGVGAGGRITFWMPSTLDLRGCSQNPTSLSWSGCPHPLLPFYFLALKQALCPHHHLPRHPKSCEVFAQAIGVVDAGAALARGREKGSPSFERDLLARQTSSTSASCTRSKRSSSPARASPSTALQASACGGAGRGLPGKRRGGRSRFARFLR